MRLVLPLLVVAALLAGCADDPAPARPTTPSVPSSTTPTGAGSEATCVSTLDATKKAKEPVVVLTTSMGAIRLTLFCDKAPVTTQHLVKLIEAGCWDATKFHRVVRGFMNQGGDPLSKNDSASARWGQGGPADCGQEPDTIVEEFYCSDGTVSTATPPTQNHPTSQCDAHGGLGLRHKGAGVWSMARTSVPATSGSQFFLTAADAGFLDGRYTVFGHTADEASTQVVLAINGVTCAGQPCRDAPAGSPRPDTPIVITTSTIEWA